MIRRLLALLSLLSVLLTLCLLFVFLASLFTDLHRSLKLPFGLEIHARSPNRLTLTLWKPETTQWWLSRPPNSPINISATSVQTTSNGSIMLYGARLHAEFATKSFAGFEFRRGAVSKSILTAPIGAMSTPLVPYSSLSMPLFYPLPLLLILPTISLRRHLRHRHRAKHNLCLTCGYDLRASTDKCPECGSPIPLPPPLLNP